MRGVGLMVRGLLLGWAKAAEWMFKGWGGSIGGG